MLFQGFSIGEADLALSATVVAVRVELKKGRVSLSMVLHESVKMIALHTD